MRLNFPAFVLIEEGENGRRGSFNTRFSLLPTRGRLLIIGAAVYESYRCLEKVPFLSMLRFGLFVTPFVDTGLELNSKDYWEQSPRILGRRIPSDE